MGVKPKKGAAKKEVSSVRAKEALKKELVHGEGNERARLKVLESLHSTAVLTSRASSVDVKFEQVTLSLFGKELINDATIEISAGRRYGLIGPNGCGKSTLLAALACRELPIPDHIDIWHVHQEADPTEVTALDAVVKTASDEVERLEALILKLSTEDPEENSDILEALGDKLDRFDTNSFIPDAGALLHGLGFTEAMMHKATKDMSGGWRMRVALSQALFKKPSLLILDEPTNHLDLGACVWLEEYLACYPSTIIMTSHSEDFMNTVCTEIMQITQDCRLIYWGGNYAQYVKTRQEQEVNQMKAYEKEQSDIAHLLEFIRSCGTYSNMRRQADSKQKIIDKMKEKGLVEKPMPDPVFMFKFPESESLPPPVCAFNDMSFSYSGKKEDYLYSKVDLGIDLDSRVALVGPNGAGKSTLLKLMRGELEACEGEIKRHSHLRIASYNQHSSEILPEDKSPLQFFQEKFDAEAEKKGEQRKSEQEWRQKLGKYGVNGDLQKRKMGTFSDGQKSRVVFALMSMANPHLLLLDEPTNHLDMACIDALAEAIDCFTGGTVLVSHDFRLISRVAKEIWVCDGGVKPWHGDIQSYKVHLSKEMKKSAKARRHGMGNCAGANTGSGAAKAVTPEPSEPSEPEEPEAPAAEETPEPSSAPAPTAPALEEEPDKVDEEEVILPKLDDFEMLVPNKKDKDEDFKIPRKIKEVVKEDKPPKKEVVKEDRPAKVEKKEPKPARVAPPNPWAKAAKADEVDKQEVKDEPEPAVEVAPAPKAKEEPVEAAAPAVEEAPAPKAKADKPKADKAAGGGELPPWLQKKPRRERAPKE